MTIANEDAFALWLKFGGPDKVRMRHQEDLFELGTGPLPNWKRDVACFDLVHAKDAPSLLLEKNHDALSVLKRAM